MMLQGLVAGPRGQGEGNMPGHISGQGVLPRKATGLVLSTQLGLLASSHHRLALWQCQGRAGFTAEVQWTTEQKGKSCIASAFLIKYPLLFSGINKVVGKVGREC